MVVEKAVEREMAGSREADKWGRVWSERAGERAQSGRSCITAGDDGALWITTSDLTLRHGVL